MSNPTIVSELRMIAKAHDGILNPSDVVDSARPIESPLHSRFEWDDSEAAQRYRLWQARQLIAITVDYVGGESGILSRVFVSLTSDRQEQGGYRAVDVVMSTKKGREAMLEDAVKDMEVFKRKYVELKELSEVFAAMRKVRVPA